MKRSLIFSTLIMTSIFIVGGIEATSGATGAIENWSATGATGATGAIEIAGATGVTGVSKITYHKKGFDFSETICPIAINNQNWILGFTCSDHKLKTCIWNQEDGFTLTSWELFSFPRLNNQNQIAALDWDWTDNWLFPNTATRSIHIMNADGTIKKIATPSEWPKKQFSATDFVSGVPDDNLRIIDFNDAGYLLLSNYVEEKAPCFAIWNAHEYIYIPAEDLDTAFAMNNSGMILGSKTKQGGKSILILYDPVTRHSYDIFDDVDIERRDLNDRGEVCFSVINQDLNIWKGFLWSVENGLTSLDYFLPQRINNTGEMVGIALSIEKVPAYFAIKGSYGFSYLQPYSEEALICDLNDYGHVTGFEPEYHIGRDKPSSVKGFRFIPTKN